MSEDANINSINSDVLDVTLEENPPAQLSIVPLVSGDFPNWKEYYFLTITDIHTFLNDNGMFDFNGGTYIQKEVDPFYMKLAPKDGVNYTNSAFPNWNLDCTGGQCQDCKYYQKIKITLHITKGAYYCLVDVNDDVFPFGNTPNDLNPMITITKKDITDKFKALTSEYS